MGCNILANMSCGVAPSCVLAVCGVDQTHKNSAHPVQFLMRSPTSMSCVTCSSMPTHRWRRRRLTRATQLGAPALFRHVVLSCRPSCTKRQSRKHITMLWWETHSEHGSATPMVPKQISNQNFEHQSTHRKESA